MTDVKPQAYACIVDGVFENVFRHKAVAEHLVDVYAKEYGACATILPLYPADEVGLSEKDVEIERTEKKAARGINGLCNCRARARRPERTGSGAE